MIRRLLLGAILLSLDMAAQNKRSPIDKFRQLEEILPTPNEYRTASGAPGHKYWQQRADYDIDVELDDVNQQIIGRASINYHNNSPDALTYLWLQLDQNIWEPHSDTTLTETAPDWKKFPIGSFRRYMDDVFQGGYHIGPVKDAAGNELHKHINRTMMRVDLPAPLAPGKSFVFTVNWDYKINNSKRISGRTGAEFFPKDGNWIYEIAQWFPRMAAYNDVNGWQHKQFLGTGEFTLEFGDYKVRITAPNDHIVASTGVLQNPEQVLTAVQRQRLTTARTAKKPVMIVTGAEATANEKSKPAGKKTWIFHAENVRDFAFASSRKFAWDAQGHDAGGRIVMAMSYYPKEGNPLWERYSTHAIIHTLNIYSRYTFQYPYPIAISVNGPVGGMEYPMICFNGPRPKDDKTYSARTKYALISVVIHEVGHNYFPMIVNSDERQWTWLDEGINSFLQFLAESEWEGNYPSRRGEPAKIVEYMKGDSHDPIMTNSETIIDLGGNAYHKTATALNILRETVLGRERFDFAFKEYARRWMFKRPMPADLFRTMEDASGTDLDWFWRGWFYTNENVDISIDEVKLYSVDTQNPDVEKLITKKEKETEPVTLSAQRNKPLRKRVEDYPELIDFYNKYDEFTVLPSEKKAFEIWVKQFEEDERKLFDPSMNFYSVSLRNIGGLVMPVILAVEFNDGTREELRVAAEIWRRNNLQVEKIIATRKEIKSITLDPHLETADIDVSNNYWPRQAIKSKFQIFKEDRDKVNPMRELKDKEQPSGQN
ncbi:MAG: M1 family metallopeptidase [Acidobacteria bacterium]|nr:M1 family metallopeptidase [Acidobacteriota bacterium]